MGQEEIKPHVSMASPLGAVTITAALGDRRQIQMAINVSAADPIDLQNEMLDRAMTLLDRQQARYDLEKEEKAFEETARHVRNFLNAIPIAEDGVKRQIAVLKVELAGMEDARKEVVNAAVAEHATNNRRGPYEPKGATLSRINAIQGEIDKKKAAIAAAPRDAEQHREQAVVNVRKYQDDMAKQRAKINDLRHMAGLPKYEGFEAEESADPLTWKG